MIPSTKVYIKKITLSGALLAFCLILPFITGNIPYIGNMLLPMHIPVLICGLVCGWTYGFIIGLAAPVLRYFLFGMPPLMPIGLAMSFELAAYGAVCGIMSYLTIRNKINLYISLITAMIFGRIVWGLVMFAIARLTELTFTWEAFISGAVVTALPGILIQSVLVPPIVMILNKAALNIDE